MTTNFSSPGGILQEQEQPERYTRYSRKERANHLGLARLENSTKVSKRDEHATR